jgi:hypothetical protein
MRRVLICLAPLVLVAACATTDPVPPVTPPLDACPPSASADLEPAPGKVAVTNDEQLALDDAGLRILGFDRFPARELSQAQGEARTRRLETRIIQTRDWCRERQRPG